jgi:hypothetical protein
MATDTHLLSTPVQTEFLGCRAPGSVAGFIAIIYFLRYRHAVKAIRFVPRYAHTLRVESKREIDWSKLFDCVSDCVYEHGFSKRL